MIITCRFIALFVERTADQREGNGHGLPLILIVADGEVGGAVRQNWVSGILESLKFKLEFLFCSHCDKCVYHRCSAGPRYQYKVSFNISGAEGYNKKKSLS